MSEVKRWDSLWWGSEEEEPYMVEDEDGKYALYSDWQSEHEARLVAEARAERAERALEILASWAYRPTLAEAALAEADKQLQADKEVGK